MKNFGTFDCIRFGVFLVEGTLFEEGEVDPFLINKITGIDEATIERLSVGIPSLTMERAESLIRFVEAELNDIIENFKRNSGTATDNKVV